MFGRSVDVFVADLRSVTADEDLLSVAELGKALSLAFSPRLSDFVAARTWVRRRLSEYLGCGPDEIRFGSDDRLEIASPATDLTFDFDYANHAAVLAIGFRKDVGIGIEPLAGQRPEPADVAATLAEEERDRFDRGINPERTFRQFRARKRALIRASGVATPLAAIDTSGLCPVERDGYVIDDLSLGDEFVASIATAGEVSLNLTIDDSVFQAVNGSVRERVDALIGISA